MELGLLLTWASSDSRRSPDVFRRYLSSRPRDTLYEVSSGTRPRTGLALSLLLREEVEEEEESRHAWSTGERVSDEREASLLRVWRRTGRDSSAAKGEEFMVKAFSVQEVYLEGFPVVGEVFPLELLRELGRELGRVYSLDEGVGLVLALARSFRELGRDVTAVVPPTGLTEPSLRFSLLVVALDLFREFGREVTAVALSSIGLTEPSLRFSLLVVALDLFREFGREDIFSSLTGLVLELSRRFSLLVVALDLFRELGRGDTAVTFSSLTGLVLELSRRFSLLVVALDLFRELGRGDTAVILSLTGLVLELSLRFSLLVDLLRREFGREVLSTALELPVWSTSPLL